MNADPLELQKFAELAHRWWDPTSEFRPLHEINPLRLEWINARASLAGKNVIDIGCGGGVLSESMAKKGAIVTGIDLSEKALKVADLHSLESGVDVRYQHIAAEDMALAELSQFVRSAGLQVDGLKGLTYNPLTQVYSLNGDTSVNYMVACSRPL